MVFGACTCGRDGVLQEYLEITCGLFHCYYMDIFFSLWIDGFCSNAPVVSKCLNWWIMVKFKFRHAHIFYEINTKDRVRVRVGHILRFTFVFAIIFLCKSCTMSWKHHTHLTFFPFLFNPLAVPLPTAERPVLHPPEIHPSPRPETTKSAHQRHRRAQTCWLRWVSCKLKLFCVSLYGSLSRIRFVKEKKWQISN